ncbi:MAG: protein kinase, partial [Phycisphaerae bacterium]
DAVVDPSKHSSQRYEGFESRSDVVAAGFLLFLMAEHRHPYFYGDPQAHRSVDMATQIVLPSPFRRADLREPEDPRLQTWCQMVRRMVSLDWEKRPSAEEALKATGVTPIDLKGIAVRQIEELKKEAVEHGLDDLMWWAQAIEKAEQLAETEGLPAERLREVQAVQLLGTAIGLMGGLDWERSEEPLARLLALPGVPASFVEKAKSIGVLRERCLAARDRLDNLEKEMADIESLPLRERSRRLDELEKAIETLVGANLLPLLDERLRPMPGGLSVRRALLRQQLDKVRAEAGEWLAQADAALAGENWEQLAGLMAAPPPATEFDEGIAAQVAEYRRQFNEHEEQERRRQQRRADLERRVSEARKLIAEEKAAEARERLGGVESQREFPDLADAGRQLLDQLVELEKRLEALRRVRARVDELLSAARSRLEARSLADLTEAEQLLEQALQTDGRSDEQTRQARGLQQQVAKVRQEIVEAWRRQKEKAQGELKKAQSQLAKHRYRDAEAAAAQLVGFDDAEIVSAAKAIIETVSRKRAEAVAEIEKQLADARERLAGAEFEAARQCVERVSGHDLAGAEHLAAAKALAGEIESARRAAEQDRQKAKAELEQSRAALDRGDFLTARRLAGQVLTSRFGEPGVKQGAQALLDATAPLAEADEYIASKDYPAAIRVLDNLLADGATPSGSLKSAAAALRERAVQERAQAEVAYLVEHLTRRAELEEKSGFVRNVPVEQTITRKIPEWAGQSLRSFETFMGDWVGDHVAADADARSTLLAPQDRFGDKYEIVRHIGRGGMGEVYLARDVMLDRLVALKLAPSVGDLKDLAEHLQIEAKAIARLDYPKHILRINSFGTTEGRYYFDTDYKEAPNLADYARENGPLSHRLIAEIVIPIAQALDYAHRKGIYHRDIKPTNILIGRSPDEGPWLIDFGLAKISSICHQRARQGLCGTPGYMAPEVIRSMGEGVDDRAADIFSLGCVLYELLTGALPYQSPRSGSVPPKSSSSVTHPPRLGASSKGGATQSLPGHRPGVARLLLNTLQAKPLVWDEKIPEPLREVCRKALAPDPRARFASASEMSEALEAFLRDLDRRDVEEGLARARAAFESRRQNEPGEPADLDEVHKQAQALSARATGRLGDEVKRLLAEVEATRGRIQEQIKQARAQIELAKVHLAESKWALAIEAATAAAEVGYEPGLKDEADPIIEEAQRRRRQQRGRTMK